MSVLGVNFRWYKNPLVSNGDPFLSYFSIADAAREVKRNGRSAIDLVEEMSHVELSHRDREFFLIGYEASLDLLGRYIDDARKDIP